MADLQLPEEWDRDAQKEDIAGDIGSSGEQEYQIREVEVASGMAAFITDLEKVPWCSAGEELDEERCRIGGGGYRAHDVPEDTHAGA